MRRAAACPDARSLRGPAEEQRLPTQEDISHLRGWKIVTDDSDPSHGKYYESMFTLGNGYLGVRGSFEEAVAGEFSEPLTLIAEVYDDPGVAEKPERLAPAPNWLCIRLHGLEHSRLLSQTRELDMKRGTLTRHARFEGPDGRITSIISERIVSQARPHVAAVAYSVIPENYSGRVKLASLIDGAATYGDGLAQTEEVSRERDDLTVSYVARTLQSKIEIAVAARHELISADSKTDARVRPVKPEKAIRLEFTFDVEVGKVYTLEKVVAIDTSIRDADPLASVESALREAPAFANLEREHAAEWRGYWRDCDIRIEGDRFVQTMARFFVFQLLQAASWNNVRLGLSASIPAKTLSGPGYNGHIFWDTEIYMLPFFSQQYPEIAESLLRYRYDRLDVARQNAKAENCRGARFPWESASSGVDTTPKWCPTGWREIHVVADVAFACWHHYLTTSDEAFFLGPSLEIILETARYWSTRAERKGLPLLSGEGGGEVRYEITEVIGPDENHDPVDNSVFTNAMARWNIRKAMDLLDRIRRDRPQLHSEITSRLGITPAEIAKWQEVADNIKINFDPATSLYEEFDGYFALEGDERKIKQADVLLMLHLLPELRTTEIFQKNFDLYHPVTLHHSSLSPGVHVLFALDVGYADHAYEYEIMACSIDGVRKPGVTDPGLHAASLGGGWSSIVAGFGGVRVMPECLSVAPDLPKKWRRLSFSTVYKNQRLNFDIRPHSVSIAADPSGPGAELSVRGELVTIKPGETIQR